MNSKLFKDIAEEVEFNYWQILMSELDSTLNRMQYISSVDLSDAYELEQFDKFFNEVKTNEAVVVSVSDNADLYELSDDSILVVLIERLNEKMVVFDKQDKRKIVSIIQKISVVRNDDNRIFEVHQKVFEPLRGLYVEVVRGFV